VKKIQAGYKAEPLVQIPRPAAPEAAPAIDFIKPLTPDDERTSPEFFNILNFVLQFCPTDPSETELMARFAKIGVGAGKTFDASKLSPEMKTAIEQGMADAWADLAALKKRVDAGEVTSGDMFGTRRVPEEQLPLPHGRCRARHLRQLQAGGDVSGLCRRCRWNRNLTAPTSTPCASRLATAAGQRLLVADDV
jgi:hypothetical protein